MTCYISNEVSYVFLFRYYTSDIGVCLNIRLKYADMVLELVDVEESIFPDFYGKVQPSFSYLVPNKC